MSHTEHASPGTKVSGELSENKVKSGDPILSDEARVVEIVFIVTVNGTISFLGSAVNVINMIIFFNQGISDSVNISLCSLAVSDLGSLLPMMWTSICYNPLFQYSDIDFDSVEVNYLTGAWFHSYFARTTTWITAFITFERCVCIALSMKLKTIITPKRTLIAMIAIFLIIFATLVPLYSAVYFTPYFHERRNKTLVGLAYTSNAKTFESLSFSCNISVQVGSFIIMIICTVILVVKLLAKSQWRQTSIFVSDVSDSRSIRDKRVIKMVTLISMTFIICYFPIVINLIVMVVMPSEYSIAGQYVNSFLVSWAIINSIEGINSSVTILVYYNMSSKFRETLKELFLTTQLHVLHIAA